MQDNERVLQIMTHVVMELLISFSNPIPYRGKNVGDLFHWVFFRRGKISSLRGIFVTFPRPKFQIRHFSPTKFFKCSRQNIVALKRNYKDFKDLTDDRYCVTFVIFY